MIMSWQRGLRTKAPHATVSEAPSSGCGARPVPVRFRAPRARIAVALGVALRVRRSRLARRAAQQGEHEALKNIVAAAATKIHRHASPSGAASRMAP